MAALFAATLSLPCMAAAGQEKSSWEGIDKTVLEHTAEQAGRPARDPYINTDRGDLLLFLFLSAGAIGGFAAGYAFRALFPPRRQAAVPGPASHEEQVAP